jgi:hypothetical protein
MSGIGRLFLFLNLIFSAVFVGWAANSLSTSEEFRMQYDQEVTDHATTSADAESAAGLAQTNLQAAEGTASGARTERDAEKLRANGLQSDLDGLNARYGTLQGNVTAMNSSINSLDGTLKDIENAKDDAVAAKAAAEQTAQNATADALAASKAQKAAEDMLGSAEMMIASLQTELESATKQVSHLDAVLATAVEMYNIPLSEIRDQPDVSATVLNVLPSGDFTLIALNKGSDDGVVTGTTFEIYDGGVYKGQVRVETVTPNMCSALVLTPVPDTTIVQGDSASTRL